MAIEARINGSTEIQHHDWMPTLTNRMEKLWNVAFAALALHELTMTNVPIPANLVSATTVALAGILVNRNIEHWKKVNLKSHE